MTAAADPGIAEELDGIAVGDKLIRRGRRWEVEAISRKQDFSAAAATRGECGAHTGEWQVWLRPFGDRVLHAFPLAQVKTQFKHATGGGE